MEEEKKVAAASAAQEPFEKAPEEETDLCPEHNRKVEIICI